MSTEQLIQRLAVALDKSSIPISEPWLLRMARIATNIHHCGKRMPRRIRHSDNALREPIRSVAAAGFGNGQANGKERVLRTKPVLAAARQRN